MPRSSIAEWPYELMLKPRGDLNNPPIRCVEYSDNQIRFSVTQPIIALALNHAAKRFDFPVAHIVAGDVFDC